MTGLGGVPTDPLALHATLAATRRAAA